MRAQPLLFADKLELQRDKNPKEQVRFVCIHWIYALREK